MALEHITEVTGTVVVVPGDDIDTDRIIPARFLRCVPFAGLGEHLFRDERSDENGASKGHPLDDPRFSGAEIMLSGRNFGCGSSREHAPQSIRRAGIRAIIAENFAEIFLGNSTTLGMICAEVTPEVAKALAARIESDPKLTVTISLKDLEITAGEYAASFVMAESARDALMNGKWDPLNELLSAKERVRSLEANLPY